MRKSYGKSSLKKLETLFMLLGYTIRYEKGQFKSGYCVVKNRNIVVINKFFETKQRILTLDTVLLGIEAENLNLSLIDEQSRAYLHNLRPDLLDTQLPLPLAS